MSRQSRITAGVARREPAPHPRRFAAPAGFTLLEVLVATAIVAIAVTALMSGFSGTLRNFSRASEYERALLLGRAQMNRLLSDPLLRPGRVEGRWDDDYRWQASIDRWNPGSPVFSRPGAMLPPVLIVRLTVFWRTPNGEKSMALETSRYLPRINQ